MNTFKYKLVALAECDIVNHIFEVSSDLNKDVWTEAHKICKDNDWMLIKVTSNLGDK